MTYTVASDNTLPSIQNLSTHSLVFIDSAVNDSELLASGVLPGEQVIILDPQKNGIEQITSEIKKYAANYGKVDTVQILSHGSPGCLYLGNSQLSSDTIEQYQSQWQQWKSALSDKADIMRFSLPWWQSTD